MECPTSGMTIIAALALLAVIAAVGVTAYVAGQQNSLVTHRRPRPASRAAITDAAADRRWLEAGNVFSKLGTNATPSTMIVRGYARHSNMVRAA
jgi:hypothetical protein